MEWFKIVCFGRLAEVCGEYLNKGRHVYLEGRLQTRKWEGPGGEKRTAIEVVANQMQILDRAPKNGNGSRRLNHRSLRSPSMKATTPLICREARRRINKSRIDGLPRTAPTCHLLKDDSVLLMDRLMRPGSSRKSLRVSADPIRQGLFPWRPV